MRRASFLVAFALAFARSAFAADDLAVDVQNASTPTLCAETDNVYVKLTSPEVRRFTIEAVHPNYIGTIVVDRSASNRLAAGLRSHFSSSRALKAITTSWCRMPLPPLTRPRSRTRQ